MTAHLQVVGHNHRPYLADCLRSCLSQTVRVPVLYVDNASADGSAAFVKENFPAVQVQANATNRGYSGGHNDGLRLIPESEVVIALNADVVLTPDFLEKGLAAFARPSIGAVSPLLLRPDGDTIDAYGDVLRRSLRAVNQYHGQSLSKLQATGARLSNPWGYTGAAVFLRRRALLDVALDGEIFDEDFFAYREDVDLSWRLRLRGWEIVGEPKSRAQHVRTARTSNRKPARVAQLSWRNYYLTLVKDVPLGTLAGHLLPVLLEDLARDLQMLSSPSLWPALPETLRLLPRMLRKRQQVQARASAARYAAGDVPRREGKFLDGRVDYQHAALAPVINCVVRQGGRILLLKRSDKVGAYRGWWHVIAGYLDEPGVAAEQKALVELQEELGIPKEAVEDVRRAEPIEAFDPDVAKTWIIHPVLVSVKGNPPIRLDWEHTEYRWVRPEEIAAYHPIPTLLECLRRLGIHP